MDNERDKSDRQIIEAVLEGDTLAFARLVERYQGPVFNLAFRMTGSRQDAEDLAQEIFLKAFLGLKRFDLQRRFFPWLFAIAVNTVRNQVKKKQPPVTSNADAANAKQAPATENSPQQRLENKQDRQKLAGALQQLSLEQREAVVLRYYQEMTFDEIAEVCSTSLSAAKMRVYRGLQHLGRIIGDSRQFEDRPAEPYHGKQ